MNALDPLIWSLLLLLVGCAVLVLEVFIPSGGLLSVVSAAALLGAIALAFQRGPAAGFAFLMTTVVVVPLLLAIAFHFWPKTKIGRAMIGELPRAEDVLPDDPHRALVGRIGIARSKMLPSGAVEIDGQMVDAITQGTPINAGQPVVVTEVRANRVVVRPARADERPLTPLAPQDLLDRPIAELGIEALDDPLT